MSDRLDQWMADLATAPTDRGLEGLEADIGRDLQRRRRDARQATTLAPVRIASIGLAMAAGMTAGGAAATFVLTAPQPYGAFSTSPNLAPSTLLEGDR
jgi:hypothetical protein